MKSFFAAPEKDAQLISSVDPMVPLRGRPFGGIGFVLDKSDGYSFSPQACHSDRIYYYIFGGVSFKKLLLNLLLLLNQKLRSSLNSSGSKVNYNKINY